MPWQHFVRGSLLLLALCGVCPQTSADDATSAAQLLSDTTMVYGEIRDPHALREVLERVMPRLATFDRPGAHWSQECPWSLALDQSGSLTIVVACQDTEQLARVEGNLARWFVAGAAAPEADPASEESDEAGSDGEALPAPAESEPSSGEPPAASNEQLPAPADSPARADRPTPSTETLPEPSAAPAADEPSTPIRETVPAPQVPSVEPGIAWHLEELNGVRLGHWLVVSTDPAKVQQAIELARGKGKNLASDTAFVAAQNSIKPSANAWVFLRAGALNSLFGLMTGSVEAQYPQIRQLVKQLVVPNGNAAYMAFSVERVNGRPQFAVHLPDDASGASSRPLLLGALDRQTPIYEPLLPESTLLSVSASINRDAIKLVNKQFLQPEMIKRLGGASPETAMLIAGLPLINDIMDQVRPPMQFIAARQSFTDPALPVPDVRLPAFAVIFRPEHPKDVKSAFMLSYLGAMRQTNTQAKLLKRPTLVLKSEKMGDAIIGGAVYRLPADDPLGTPGAMIYNFSPSMAVVGDRFIVSSSLELTRELVALANARGEDKTIDRPLRVDVGPAGGAHWLVDNLRGLMRPPSAASQAPSQLQDEVADLLSRIAERIPQRTGEVRRGDRGPLRARIRSRLTATP